MVVTHGFGIADEVANIVAATGGRLRVERHGAVAKLVDRVAKVTLSGSQALARRRKVV